MSFNIQQIDHLAHLARLDLTEAEKELYASQLDAVFSYFQKLQAVDTTGLEPLSQVIPLRNVLRVDEPITHPDDRQQKIIHNAPDKTGRHIRVKKVLWML